MAKKLSGWFRRYIVFAVVWTALAINYLTLEFHRYNTDYPPLTIEEIKKQIELIEEINKEYDLTIEVPDVQTLHKRDLRVHYKGIRKRIYFFFLYWLAPVGLVYGSGHCAGWIYRGFRKEKK